MLRCDKCKVDLTGPLRRCPLCGSELRGAPDGEHPVFPPLRLTPPRSRLPVRLALFLSVVAAVVCSGVNLCLPQSGIWSLFVTAGLMSFWLAFGVAVRKRRSILKSLLWLAVLISVLAVLWDIQTGFSRWSLNFVLPLLLISLQLLTLLFSWFFHLPLQDYLIYLTLGGLFGFVPLILFLFGQLRVPYPSVICAAVSLISLSALWLFQGRALRAEIRRRLHL